MKKVYKKPIVYIERFNINEKFAYGCGLSDANHRNGDECTYAGFFYGEHCGAFDLSGGDWGTVEDECYQGAFESGSPFAS